ncbi:MAG: hypothetical protein ACREBR_00075 [bacterium]
MLLAHSQSKGIASEEELRTVAGMRYTTCQETCAALGLLETDEWRQCLEEISFCRPAFFARDLFVTIVIENTPADVPHLFELFFQHMHG